MINRTLPIALALLLALASWATAKDELIPTDRTRRPDQPPNPLREVSGDMTAAARRWVPVLVAIMATTFSVYLVMKGLKKIWKPEGWMIGAIGGIAFVAIYTLVKPVVARASANLENRRKAVSSLFTIPLIFSAALLSFAHGANDVANAVGPLAGIVDAATTGTISAKVDIPIWVMVVGAVGISAGLVLFGPRLIRTVGEQITRPEEHTSELQSHSFISYAVFLLKKKNNHPLHTNAQ